MANSPEYQRPMEPADEAEKKLLDRYYDEFGTIDIVHFPDGASPEIAKKADELRLNMQTNFQKIISLQRNEESYPAGITELIDNLWQRMSADFIAYRRLYEEAVMSTANIPIETTVPLAPLSVEVDRLFDNDAGEPFIEKLRKIAEALETSGEPSREARYVTDAAQINADNVAEDLHYIEKLQAAATPEQSALLDRMRAQLLAIGKIDTAAMRREIDVQQRHEAYTPTPVASALKMAALAGTLFLAAWSIKEKNWKLLALYGGLSLYLYNSDIFRGKGHNVLEIFSVANSKEMREMRKKYLKGEEGIAAIEEAFVLQDEKGTELKELLDTGLVTKKQALQLADNNPQNPLYKVLADMPNDRERRQLLWRLKKFNNREVQDLYTQYVTAETKAIS